MVARALDSAAAGDSGALRALILAEDDEQVTLALSKIRVRYPDIGEPWTRGNAPEGPVTADLLSTGMRLVGELPDRSVGWTSTLSQTSYWMTNLLRLLLDTEPNADVDPALSACTQTHRRAHVLSSAAKNLDSVRPETQEALQRALRREAVRLIPLLLADLRQGDTSDGEAGGPFLYGFVEAAGLLPELRARIQDDLDSGAFTLADIAARFVSFAYVVGGAPGAPPSSASFSGDLFTKVTDVEADTTDLSERETWTDTSWGRRRAFAAKYVKGPVPTCSPATAASGEDTNEDPGNGPS